MGNNEILDFLSNNKYFLVVLLVVIVLSVYMLIRSSKKRALRQDFEAIEVQYNELMSIPILFKINKAVGLSKVNDNLKKEVSVCNELFEDLRQQQDELVAKIGDADDALAYGKLKEARYLLNDLDSYVLDTLEKTENLDQKLESLLEEETRLRIEINKEKSSFRDLKKKVKRNEKDLLDSYPLIENHIQEIEHMFSNFEEWMYASNFKKAQEMKHLIHDEIVQLDKKTEEIPQLYSRAKGYIPELLDEVSRLYQGIRQEGIYIEHLEVPKNIGVLSEQLKSDLIQISKGEIAESDEQLSKSEEKLETLVREIHKEELAHHEVNEIYTILTEQIDSLSIALKELVNDAQTIEKRFNFSDFNQEVGLYRERFKEISGRKEKIHNMIFEEKIPASSILLSLKELEQDTQFLLEDFDKTRQKAERANADEVRARKQLLKLHLIINDVQVRIKKRSLPSISQKYESDLQQSYRYTNQIKEMLSQESLDVNLLNATVDEAIDYIYKLHNNVNNLVGVVDMCENAIVYANKYRAYVPDIDAELTRAELSFNNGEYTQSLTTIINSIDNFKPNTEYEAMIRENAQSAQ